MSEREAKSPERITGPPRPRNLHHTRNGLGPIGHFEYAPSPTSLTSAGRDLDERSAGGETPIRSRRHIARRYERQTGPSKCRVALSASAGWRRSCALGGGGTAGWDGADQNGEAQAGLLGLVRPSPRYAAAATQCPSTRPEGREHAKEQWAPNSRSRNPATPNRVTNLHPSMRSRVGLGEPLG